MFSTSHIQPHRSSRCFALSAWSLEVHQVGCSCISCRYRSGRVCRAGTISSPDLLSSPSELRLRVIPIHVVCCGEFNILIVRERVWKITARSSATVAVALSTHCIFGTSSCRAASSYNSGYHQSIAHLLHMQQQAQ